jgi:hypothetical protein
MTHPTVHPDEGLMTTRSFSRLVQRLVHIMLVGSAACAATAVVKPTCTISWDRSADQRVAEYRVTVRQVAPQAGPIARTHVVKAPATQISCHEAGANRTGTWQATVQACLKDGTCGAKSRPIKFEVTEK